MTISTEPKLHWTSTPPTSWSGDVRGLANALREALQGEVGFDQGSRGLYATDASNYRQAPVGVVWPRSIADVQRTVEICRDFDVPILGRGGGTSLAGQCCNVAVVIDMSRYLNQVLAIDRQARQARVQPGVILDQLRTEVKQYGLTFGPDPATHSQCTLGGMIGNNSCGVHSVMAGRTADNVDEMEVLTYDGHRMRVGPTSEEQLQRRIEQGGREGEIYGQLRDLRDRYADLIRQRFPDIPRRVSGYGLEQLLPENGFHLARALAGTEGTCVTFLEATLRLIEFRPERILVVAGFDDAFHAADYVPEVLQTDPIGLEGLDRRLVEDNRKKHMHLDELDQLPAGGGWLLVEYGAYDRREALEQARRLREILDGREHVMQIKIVEDDLEQERIWGVRESGLGATARVPGQPDTWPGWEDSAVPPEQLGAYLRELRKLLQDYDYEGAFYGHFGQGCLHTRITFSLHTKEEVVKYRRFVDQAADLVIRYGGSLSGEHGDGQARGELLPKMYGPELCEAFRQFKRIWDPQNRMNPGKVVSPYPITSNLRLGEHYHPPTVKTHFQYPDDDFNFARATLRCVGVGKCRREEGGTMCPSYMVTRDEKHTTRGRAHLLFEMLQGDIVTEGWRSDEVKESLDLCLACKGCKHDCPINVDLATYKAEFFSHYYRGRLRPMSAYSMGGIYWWARLASRMPRLVNTLTHAPLLGRWLKQLGGIAVERQMPEFAVESFRARFARHQPRHPQGTTVILWPDTFNNFFHPETAEAAVEVLESAGFHVTLPPRILCCGRPLYDFGMLDLAKRQLRQILETLQPQIEDGVPVIGLEPSCVATFRDEMLNLMPNDENAKRLAQQTFLLSEFVEQHADRFPLKKLNRSALVHGHCHHKAVLGIEAEKKVLQRLGLEVEMPDSGCCGMAGSFGFEPEKYEVSIACGERVLLPKVRESSPETLILTDGFSCREQVWQGTNRWPLHLAEVLQEAIQSPSSLAARYPERTVREEASRRLNRGEVVLLAGAAAALTGLGIWQASRLLRR